MTSAGVSRSSSNDPRSLTAPDRPHHTVDRPTLSSEVISLQNTIKIPTIGWGIAALVFFPFFVPNSYNISLFGIRFLPAALFAYLAYRAYKNGLTAGASAEERALARHQAFAAVALSVVGVILGIGFGLIRPPNFNSVMPSVASIEGKYRDPNGSTVEFLGDGTAVIVIHGTQAIWK
ncbi:hypothetical protein AB0V79_27325 [Mesorhizobium ciceri]|uniref:hypothetical protein n=1 Tax=Mesorhizobium ciceri TaxID=39645 RepID=UPI0007A94833|nr:hypothetical protein [Mesorhizobium ciceri]AMY00677.1 hypothetical protein A4R29_15100 [Mesorhizobium ciceri biovar biserrulae]